MKLWLPLKPFLPLIEGEHCCHPPEQLAPDVAVGRLLSSMLSYVENVANVGRDWDGSFVGAREVLGDDGHDRKGGPCDGPGIRLAQSRSSRPHRTGG